VQYLIRVGTLIDGVSDQAKTDQVILIEDGTIKWVKGLSEVKLDDPQIPPVIDASDQVVMPGMVDCHVHVETNGEPDSGRYRLIDLPGSAALRALSNAQACLRAGFTTVRDCHGMEVLALRDAIDSGSLRGPRIVSCGYGVSATNGHMDWDRYPGARMRGNYGVADDPGAVRRVTRELLRLGADFIKTNATGGSFGGGKPGAQEMTEEELRAVTEAAHFAGKRVASHAMGAEGISAAVNAGVDSIEHGFWLTESTAEDMAQRGTYFVPTLTTLYFNTTRGFAGPYLSEERKQVLKERAHDVRERLFASVDLARRFGVTIASGSDVGGGPFITHGENATELVQLVEAGLSEMDAIRSATSIAAELLDLGNQIGRIDTNYAADLVFLNSNPLDDIRILTDKGMLAEVLKDGRPVLNSLPIDPMGNRRQHHEPVYII